MTDLLASQLNKVQSRIAECQRANEKAGNSAGSVRLVAVSKKHPASSVLALLKKGQKDFGENYVQEGLEKIKICHESMQACPAIWHFIGGIQSNKCRDIAQHFDWVQTISREKEVRLLNEHALAAKRTLQCLVQVNIDADSNKSGATPKDALLVAEAIQRSPALSLRGLMTITANDELEKRSESFKEMHKLYSALESQFSDAPIDTLSMGMTDDMEQAITCGSTMLRIGTAIFGTRPGT